MKARSAGVTEMAWIRSALSDSGLPTEDLQDGSSVEFLIAADGDEDRLGAIGVELHGRYGLLRSLVVVPQARNRGVGAFLVAALERRMAELALSELWLLTIDAESFFVRQGFEIAARDKVPAEIRATEEFATLCPATAHVMRKALD